MEYVFDTLAEMMAFIRGLDVGAKLAGDPLGVFATSTGIPSDDGKFRVTVANDDDDGDGDESENRQRSAE